LQLGVEQARPKDRSAYSALERNVTVMAAGGEGDGIMGGGGDR
jgi:hypothetical protein